MRRIKICTESPLPPLKAWFPIKDTIDTVYQLKYSLTHDLAVLVQGGHKRNDIDLEIDGFGLLDGSSVTILNFATDVLHIKLGLSPAETSRKKRKLSDSIIVSAKKQKKKNISATADHAFTEKGRQDVTNDIHLSQNETVTGIHNADKKATQVSVVPSLSRQTSSSASSSSSSSSSSSDDTTSSSSATSSSSESESDPDSDTSPAHATVTQMQPHPAVVAIGSIPPFVSNIVGTPPGSGKKSTRERNLRRRASRKAQKDSSSLPLPDELDTIALGKKPPSELRGEVSNVRSSLPTPRTMSNKNKKKGFLQTMEGATGKRTVYSDPADAAEVAQQLLAVSPEEQLSRPTDLPFSPARPSVTGVDEGSFSGNSPMRLPPLPPSRMTRLASNLIVTSKWFSVPNRQEAMKEIKKEAQHLAKARTEFDLTHPTCDASTDLASLKGWNDMVEKFDGLAPITTGNVKKLQEGGIVAWKSLQLNQSTWQPELRVQFGRLINMNDSDATIAPLSRPVEPPEDDVEQDPEAGELADREAEVEETVTVPTLCQGDYRIV